MAKANKTAAKKSNIKDAFLEVLGDRLTPGDIEEMLNKMRGENTLPKAAKTTKATKSKTTVAKRLGRPRKPITVEAETEVINVRPDYKVQRVRNLLASVDKHVASILVTVHKIQDAGAVPEEVFDIIDTKLENLKLSGYKANAAATSYEPRTSKGGRKPKVVQEQEAAA